MMSFSPWVRVSDLIESESGCRSNVQLAACRREANAAFQSVMVDCVHEKNIQNGGL